MSCRCFFRLIAWALLTAMTVLTIVSLVAPLAERSITNGDGSSTVITISFVDIKLTNTTGKVVTTSKVHTRDVACAKARRNYIGALAMTVIAAIVGGLNVFVGLVWIMAPCGCPLGILVFLFTLVSFAGTLIPFALIAYNLTAVECTDALMRAIVSSETETLVAKAGYVVLLIAFIGYFVAIIMQLVGLCCGCMLERSRGSKARDPTIEGMYSNPSLYGTEMNSRTFNK